jgi:hypothetical protein
MKEDYKYTGEERNLFDRGSNFDIGDIVTIDNSIIAKENISDRTHKIGEIVEKNKKDNGNFVYDLKTHSSGEGRYWLCHRKYGILTYQFPEDKLKLFKPKVNEANEYNQKDLFDRPPKFKEGDLVKILEKGEILHGPGRGKTYKGNARIWEFTHKYKGKDWYYRLEPTFESDMILFKRKEGMIDTTFPEDKLMLVKSKSINEEYKFKGHEQDLFDRKPPRKFKTGDTVKTLGMIGTVRSYEWHEGCNFTGWLYNIYIPEEGIYRKFETNVQPISNIKEESEYIISEEAKRKEEWIKKVSE